MVSSIDVAKHAGVSQTTVSRVMNSPDKVDKKTLDKVRTAMEELNYRPNAAARSLVSQKSQSITLLSGPLDNPVYAETASSISAAAAEAGYGLHLIVYDRTKRADFLSAVLSQQTDGMIITAAFNDPLIFGEIDKMNIPFISLNDFEGEEMNIFGMNNIHSGKLAARHLLDLGHKEIIWISGALENPVYSGRLEGFLQELEEEQLSAVPENMILAEETAESVWEVIKTLMARKKRPTAILAGSDVIALQVMDFLLEFGYDIPGDISIMGIDNIKMGRHRAFNLSTVGTFAEENIGKLAAEHLISFIEDQGHPRDRIIQESLEVKLFERGTTRAKGNSSS